MLICTFFTNDLKVVILALRSNSYNQCFFWYHWMTACIMRHSADFIEKLKALKTKYGSCKTPNRQTDRQNQAMFRLPAQILYLAYPHWFKEVWAAVTSHHLEVGFEMQLKSDFYKSVSVWTLAVCHLERNTRGRRQAQKDECISMEDKTANSCPRTVVCRFLK